MCAAQDQALQAMLTAADAMARTAVDLLQDSNAVARVRGAHTRRGEQRAPDHAG